MLEIAAPIERQIAESAEARGVTVEQYLLDLLSAEPARSYKLAPATPVPADDPILLFLNAQIAEAENSTPAELAEADAEYLKVQRGMNETRRANGERILFPSIDEK